MNETIEFFSDYKQISTIVHVFSVVIGMGSALVSDILFNNFIKDKKINISENTTLSTLSKVVWVSLFCIVLSGIALFLSDPIKYSNSVKFFVKMTIVGVVIINGYMFQRVVHPALKKISFTGSTRVGKILMDGASKTSTKLSLELGGNAPVIISGDVDVDVMAKSAVLAKMRNAGQVCISPQRFFVQEKIYDRFVDVAKENIQKLKVGNGLETETNVGPLINKKQQQHVLNIIDEAKKAGATTTATNINAGKGWFVSPTLLTEVDATTEAINKEIFGPVLPLIPFGNKNDVVAWANKTPYGLASYVWTNNLNDAYFFAEALEFGMVGINEWLPQGVEAPFLGWKQSALGSESGSEGLYEYMEKKLISFGGMNF